MHGSVSPTGQSERRLRAGVSCARWRARSASGSRRASWRSRTRGAACSDVRCSKRTPSAASLTSLRHRRRGDRCSARRRSGRRRLRCTRRRRPAAGQRWRQRVRPRVWQPVLQRRRRRRRTWHGGLCCGGGMRRRGSCLWRLPLSAPPRRHPQQRWRALPMSAVALLAARARFKFSRFGTGSRTAASWFA